MRNYTTGSKCNVGCTGFVKLRNYVDVTVSFIEYIDRSQEAQVKSPNRVHQMFRKSNRFIH